MINVHLPPFAHGVNSVRFGRPNGVRGQTAFSAFCALFCGSKHPFSHTRSRRTTIRDHVSRSGRLLLGNLTRGGLGKPHRRTTLGHQTRGGLGKPINQQLRKRSGSTSDLQHPHQNHAGRRTKLEFCCVVMVGEFRIFLLELLKTSTPAMLILNKAKHGFICVCRAPVLLHAWINTNHTSILGKIHAPTN
jgi:hypothetical protein